MALALAGGPAASAERADDLGIVTFQVENDVIAGTDRNYTNGLRASYRSPEVPRDHWSFEAAR
ncbi:MAG: lipid A deacylase LpxR family protein, partial [Kiloniellales bacterium]|nr:lipid A deacylase LpxR family protein [Kiloniellales bacterium]